MTSPDLAASNVAKIAEWFPEVITETVDAEGNPISAVDFDLLRQELSDHLVEGPQERYQLDWPGKRASAFAANAPIAKTLRPVREQSVDFDKSKNLFIEGDNLDALKLLQESYLGKVKLIYIDPPYNTGGDFLYDDNFAESNLDYLRNSGQIDEDGFRFVANLESSGRIHSAWLSSIYPRLKIARTLLAEDGVMFVSIGRDEQANLRRVCDEIFGERNFIETLIWNKRVPKNDEGVGSIHEYVLAYARNKDELGPLTVAKDGIQDVLDLVKRAKSQGKDLKEAEAELRVLFKKNGYDRGITLYNTLTDDYRLFGKVNMSWPNGNTEGPRYDVLHPKTSEPVKVPDRGWRWKYETFVEASGFDASSGQYNNMVTLHDGSFLCGRIWFAATDAQQPSSVTFLDDVERFLLRSVISLKSDGGVEVEALFGGKSLFPYPKPTSLLKQLIQSHAGARDGIVLDFYAGSAATAHAVMEANAEDGGERQFILVQADPPIDAASEVAKAGFSSIADFARERVRRVATQIRDGSGLNGESLDLGFRALRVDTTNMADVLRTPDETTQEALGGLEGSVKTGRTAEDLLFQVLLDWGMDISARIETEQLHGSAVFSVDDGALLACFDGDVSQDLVRVLAKREPLRAVFRDSGFASDDARINAEQIFKELSPATDVKAI
ncbi:site-specific DNA-methyltransferase [Nocardioides sp. T5]|uniref:site-specific DNA-methyltransferase n=1 Tax=Nocardioides sp. T5 TaxID=3400182 RepID=UPI003A8B305E